MNNEKNKPFWENSIKEYFSIPNIMGYFRILLIPVYLYIYFTAQNPSDYKKALTILLVSAITDLLDGKLARGLNQVTAFGKVLDPVADKLTQAAVLWSLTFRYLLMREVLAIFFVKEAYMAIMGLMLMKKGWSTEGAIWRGKICTALLYISAIILMMPDTSLKIANALMVLCIVFIIVTLIAYVQLYSTTYKQYARGTPLAMADAKEQMRLQSKRRKKTKVLIIILFVIYMLAGAVIPFMKQQQVSSELREGFSTDTYYSESEGVDRAMLIEDNGEALRERIRLISQAKERVVLSTFDFKDDESGFDMLAVLLAAADRGVSVEIFVDGFNCLLNIEANPRFYALSAHDNAKIIVYNRVNLLAPWRLMGRMHDKYVIVDDLAFILGGRNTFDYFLGNYGGHLNYDRDVLVYNSAGKGSDSSLYQVEKYYEYITSQSSCSLFHDSPEEAERISVIKARHELEERYKAIEGENPELFENSYNYGQVTYSTNKISLISNPVTLYAKEPTAFYSLYRLMKEADQSVKIHTPYVMLDDYMLETFRDIAASTNAEVMFNSAANNGNPFAASDYYYHKAKVVDTAMSILEYEGGVSYHGKSIAIDDDIAIVGSFNMDMRSVYIDTEVMLVINSKELNSQLRTNMESYEKQAVLVLDEDSYELPEGYVMKEINRKKAFQIKAIHYLLGWMRFLL